MRWHGPRIASCSYSRVIAENGQVCVSPSNVYPPLFRCFMDACEHGARTKNRFSFGFFAFFAVVAHGFGCGSPGEGVARPPPPGWDGGQQDADGHDAQCSPKTCSMLGAQCGHVPDGCGGALACGQCPPNMVCGGSGPNQCGTASCVPRTCVQLGACCGTVSDGCSQILDCGQCTPPEICGGTGVPNSCAPPCEEASKSCAGTCVALDDPAFGCEMPLDPSTPCAPCPSAPNATPACQHGSCALACSPLWGDCDANPANGCETDLNSVDHCGDCKTTCSTTHITSENREETN